MARFIEDVSVAAGQLANSFAPEEPNQIRHHIENHPGDLAFFPVSLVPAMAGATIAPIAPKLWKDWLKVADTRRDYHDVRCDDEHEFGISRMVQIRAYLTEEVSALNIPVGNGLTMAQFAKKMPYALIDQERSIEHRSNTNFRQNIQTLPYKGPMADRRDPNFKPKYLMGKHYLILTFQKYMHSKKKGTQNIIRLLAKNLKHTILKTHSLIVSIILNSIIMQKKNKGKNAISF